MVYYIEVYTQKEEESMSSLLIRGLDKDELALFSASAYIERMFQKDYMLRLVKLHAALVSEDRPKAAAGAYDDALSEAGLHTGARREEIVAPLPGARNKEWNPLWGGDWSGGEKRSGEDTNG